ncbi:MAG TPA: hypothetical protein VGJ55_08555, partial [Pyrinomonadaceae bacterium]
DEDGVISTRRGNVSGWINSFLGGSSPVGKWTLSLKYTDPNDDTEIRNRFKTGEIEDILFVITYSGRTPEWPS